MVALSLCDFGNGGEEHEKGQRTRDERDLVSLRPAQSVARHTQKHKTNASIEEQNE